MIDVFIYVGLQQVDHGALRQVLGLCELLQSLPQLLLRVLPMALLLVVVVQTPALQLLQVVLRVEEERIGLTLLDD